MTCTDWTNILFGALVGAVIGLLISELRIYLSNQRIKSKLKKHFSRYEGKYDVRTKGGQKSQLESVEVDYLKKNVLKIKLETETNGTALGKIIMDQSTLAYGKAYYKHIDKGQENLSGFYDIMFFEPGVIHAKVSYLLGSTREEISEFYIWTKK